MEIDRRELIKAVGIIVAETALNFPVSRALTSKTRIQESAYSNIWKLIEGRKSRCVGSHEYEYSCGGILHTHFQNYRTTNNAIVLLDKTKPLGVLASVSNSHFFNGPSPFVFHSHNLFNRLDSNCPLVGAEELHDSLYRKSMTALHIRNKDSTLIPDSKIEKMLGGMGFKNIEKLYIDTRENRQKDIALDIDNLKLYIFSNSEPVMLIDFS